MKEKSETGRKKNELPAKPGKESKSSPAKSAKAKAAGKRKEKSFSPPTKSAVGSETMAQKKKCNPTSRARRESAEPSSTICNGYVDVAVAAYLNWCHRRKQNLPDDPFADWIAAESEMSLVN